MDESELDSILDSHDWLLDHIQPPKMMLKSIWT
jgi:hypothetical protein